MYQQYYATLLYLDTELLVNWARVMMKHLSVRAFIIAWICFSNICSYISGQVQQPTNICSQISATTTNSLDISTPGYPNSIDGYAQMNCWCLLSWNPIDGVSVSVSRSVWSFTGYTFSCWGHLTLQYSASQTTSFCLSNTPSNNTLLYQTSASNLIVGYKRDETTFSRTGKFLLNISVSPIDVNIGVICGSGNFPTFPTRPPTIPSTVSSTSTTTPIPSSSVSSSASSAATLPFAAATASSSVANSNLTSASTFDRIQVTSTQNDPGAVIGIVVGICGAAIFVITLVIIACFVRHKRKTKTDKIRNSVNGDNNLPGSTTVLNPEFNSNTENLHQIETEVPVYAELDVRTMDGSRERDSNGEYLHFRQLEAVRAAPAAIASDSSNNQQHGTTKQIRPQQSVYAEMDQSTKRKENSNSEQSSPTRKDKQSELLQNSPSEQSEDEHKCYSVLRGGPSLNGESVYEIETAKSNDDNTYESCYASLRPDGASVLTGSNAISEYYIPETVTVGNATNTKPEAEAHYYNASNLNIFRRKSSLGDTTLVDNQLYTSEI